MYWPVAKITTTPTSHGLPQYGAVDIVTNDSFAGTYAALAVDDAMTTFRYRLSFLPGGDVPGNSCSIVRRIHRFDEVARMLQPKTAIHVGPGTFETRGHASIYSTESNFENVPVGWVLRAGQRLLGSGMNVTVLKLVLPVDEWNQTAAVSSAYAADYAEVADMTVDANVSGHVAPFSLFPAPFTCGGVTVVGSFLSARRVRVVNFCVQSLPECFPLGFAADDSGVATFNVIEDCVVEQPGENNTHETTLLSVQGGSYAGGRSLIARHNYHCATYANGISSEPIAIDSIVYNNDANGNPDGTCTVTTKRPHHRVVGQNNVLLARITQINPTVDSSPFNGVFLILDPPPPPAPFDSATQFRITKPPGAPANASWLVFYKNGIYAAVGPDFFGRGAIGGTGCVTEGNAFHDCVYGIYQDTGSTRDMVVRDNYFSNVGVGAFMNFPAISAYGVLIVDGTSAIVPVADPGTGQKRGVFNSIQSLPNPIDFVNIREAGQFAADPSNPYHGTNLQVIAALSDTQFVYRLVNQGALLPVDNCAGRPVFALSIAISTMAYNSGTKVLTIVTTSAHGLASGAYVTLDGIQYPVGTSIYSGFVGPVTPDATDNSKFTVTLGASDPEPTQASGTGGAMDTATVAISTLAYDVATKSLTVATRTSHGLQPGDFVTIGRTTGFDGFFGPVASVAGLEFTLVPPAPLPTSGSGGLLNRQSAAGVVRNSNMATITTATPHPFFIGQTLEVGGTYVNNVTQNGYNGVVQITGVSREAFTYQMKPVGGSVPPGSASPTGLVKYHAHWDLRCFIVEANCVDFYPTDSTSALAPIGLNAFGLQQDQIPPYLFRAFFWQENMLRHLDEIIPGSTPTSAGIVASTIEQGFVSQNVLDVSSPTPLSYKTTKDVRNLENLSSAGSLYRGVTDGTALADLESLIEAATALAML